MELIMAPETLDTMLLELQHILEHGTIENEIVFQNLADLYAIIYEMTDVYRDESLVFTITDARLKPLI